MVMMSSHHNDCSSYYLAMLALYAKHFPLRLIWCVLKITRFIPYLLSVYDFSPDENPISSRWLVFYPCGKVCMTPIWMRGTCGKDMTFHCRGKLVHTNAFYPVYLPVRDGWRGDGERVLLQLNAASGSMSRLTSATYVIETREKSCEHNAIIHT